MKKLTLVVLVACLSHCAIGIVVSLGNKDSAMGGNTTGFLMAYVDYDGDSLTDLILLNNDKKSIDVILMSDEPARLHLFTFTDAPNSICSLIPGDFDGNSLMDLVILVSANPQKGPYSVFVVYRNMSGDMNKNAIKVADMNFPPLMLDYNADGIADLMGDVVNSGNTYFRGSSGGFEKDTLKLNAQWSSPGFSAFVDAQSLFRPGIFLSQPNNKFVFIPNVDTGFSTSNQISIDPPEGGIQLFGAPLFFDWFFNGSISMLLQYCLDNACEDSRIAVYNFGSRTWRVVEIEPKGTKWQFVLTQNVPLYNTVTLPAIMPARPGDINLDQAPDALLLLKLDGLLTAAVFKGSLDRPGELFTLEALPDIPSPVDVAFFDYLEDGTPDTIAMRESGGTSSVGLYIQSSTSVDAYFLKVMVLTGKCPSVSRCPKPPLVKLPYGLPVPGATLTYVTEGVNGGKQTAKAVLSCSSSFQSLQLPYHIFGLGSFANYIEDLTLGMPAVDESTRKHTFNFLVPKSKVVLIPFPLESPSKWTYQLFLNPLKDKKVLYVAVTLLCTALMVIVIICILQYLEYREDKLEKLQEVQKFNFDAM